MAGTIIYNISLYTSYDKIVSRKNFTILNMRMQWFLFFALQLNAAPSIIRDFELSTDYGSKINSLDSKLWSHGILLTTF